MRRLRIVWSIIWMPLLWGLGGLLVIDILSNSVNWHYNKPGNNEPVWKGFAIPDKGDLFWSIVIFMFTLTWELTAERSKELMTVLKGMPIFLTANSDYLWLINAHNNLKARFREFLTDTYKNSESRPKGVVIGETTDPIYINWLENCLKNTGNSYEAYLSKRYPPHWFFEDKNWEESYKVQYLKKVNEKKLKIKRRLIIIKKAILKESFELMGELKTKRFFELHSHTPLYFIDEDKLKESDFRDFYQKIMLSLDDDYALIDKCLVIRKAGAEELCVYLDGLNPFTVLFDDSNWTVYNNLFQNQESIIKEFELEKWLTKSN